MNIKKKNLISNYINNVFSQKDEKGVRAIVKEFKKNPSLKEAYYAINNLQYGTCNDVDDFISHNKKIYTENKHGFDSYQFKVGKLSQTDESISYVLENEKKASNYEKYDRHYENVKNHIKKNKVLKENQQKVKELLNTIKSKSDQKIFKQLCESQDKEDFFVNYRDQVILQINSMLSEEKNKEQRLLLFEAKEKIKEKLFTQKGFVDDVMYIKKLEDILSE